MFLTIDIGNTSAKVAVMDGREVVHFERRGEAWPSLLARLERDFGGFCRVAVSNVAGPDRLLETLLERMAVPVDWLTWRSEEALRFLKWVPEGLGADRLAAVVAARVAMPGTDLLVVDAGTCLTFDVVDAEGAYVGGNISPGVSLRLRSMHEHTAALPLVSAAGEVPDVGYDTETAMRGGAMNGVKWEIEGYVRMLLPRYPNLHVFFTGGNEFRFEETVARCITCDPMLVLRGLYELYG